MPFRAEACERQARLEGLGRQAGPVLERAPRAVPRILAVKFVALLRDLQRDHEPIGEGLGLGKANGALEGGLHIRAPKGTPMANAMLSMMHVLGHDDMDSFGDSTGEFALNLGSAASPDR